MAKKKKVGKKKVVKKKKEGPAQIHDGQQGKDLVAYQRTVTLRTTLNKATPGGAEKVITQKYGVTILPAGVPLSHVRVKTHGTFNMGDYNSIQASIEVEDVTVSNPQARANLFSALLEEALEFNVTAAQRVAKKLFNRDIDMEG